jgi:tetratricopeptide (TPR) repeat protein
MRAGGEWHRLGCIMGRQVVLGIVLLVCAAGSTGLAQNQTSSTTDEAAFTERTRRALIESRKQFHSNSNNVEAAWRFARACFDLADVAETDDLRADWAEQGIAVCRQLIARQPNLVGAQYYLGMNLGQLARTKTLGALRIVDEMERIFKKTRELDERFDYAGSDRNLGLLYLQAPSIGSIGNRTKARQHLRRAVELAPEDPGNRLNLIDAYLKWGDRNNARRELQALEERLPAMRAQFVGEDWARNWKDWERRLAAVRKKLQDQPKVLESPRHSSESN